MLADFPTSEVFKVPSTILSVLVYPFLTRSSIIHTVTSQYRAPFAIIDSIFRFTQAQTAMS